MIQIEALSRSVHDWLPLNNEDLIKLLLCYYNYWEA